MSLQERFFLSTTVRSVIEEYLFARQRVIILRTHRWYSQNLKIFGTWCEEQHLFFENLSAPIIRQFLHFLTRPEEEKAKHSESTCKGYTQVIKGWLIWYAREEAYEGFVSGTIASRIEYPCREENIRQCINQHAPGNL